MAFDPNTQERIYRGLKREYLDGAYAAGGRLDIQGIADRYRASPTPVREAIHRMVGEQLLEGNPEGGIRVVLPDSTGLADLYLWNGEQLLAALRRTSAAALRAQLRPFGGMSIRGGLQDVLRIGEIFRAIGTATGNREFVDQIERCNERLHYVRLAELRVIGDPGGEIGAFLRNGQIDMRSNVRRRLNAYHRRRLAHIDAITAALAPAGLPTS